MPKLKCPYCGANDWVHINVQTSGWFRTYFQTIGGEAILVDEEVDIFDTGNSKTVWCCSCHKRRYDLYVENGILRQK